MSKFINYYVDGITAKGFPSYLLSNIQECDRIAFLMGACESAKSKIMGDIGALWANEGYEVEFIHNTLDKTWFRGVINPKLKCAIVDGLLSRQRQHRALGIVEEYVSFLSAIDRRLLGKYQEDIERLEKAKNESLRATSQVFTEALGVHDDWEKIYINHMNFEIADRVSSNLANRILGKQQIFKTSTLKDRFLGAATPEGSVHFIGNLTDDLTKRVFIKGRPGTGKSTLLRKILIIAQEKGFDVESYHCGFDPDSLDMIILRELGVAIFDSTTPHEIFPERVGDEILDLYELCVEKGTDENHEEELAKIQKQYRDKIKKGIEYLNVAKSFIEETEEIYLRSMNYSRLNQMKIHLLKFLEKN